MSKMSALDEIKMVVEALSRERNRHALLEGALSEGKISESTYRHFQSKQEVWKERMKEKQDVVEETVKDEMRELEEELLLLERCLMRLEFGETESDCDREKRSSRKEALIQGIKGCREYLRDLEEGLVLLRSISSEGIDFPLNEKEKLEITGVVRVEETEETTEDFGRQLIVLHGSQPHDQSDLSSNDSASRSLVSDFSPSELKENSECRDTQSSVVEGEPADPVQEMDNDYREEDQVEEKTWKTDLDMVEEELPVDNVSTEEDEIRVDLLAKSEDEKSIVDVPESQQTDKKEAPETEEPLPQDVVKQNPRHLVQRLFRAFIK